MISVAAETDASRAEMALHELEKELHVEIVPGTEVMTDVGSHHYVKGKDAVVLIPQPSDDPNDPLNWSTGWKMSTIATMLLVTFAQTMGPLAISPIFPELIRDFDSDLSSVIQFVGIVILLLGFSNFVWIPLGDTYGRRVVLILSQALNIAGSFWRATATSYQSFLGASVLLGLGAGQALQPAIVADVTFLHQRGFYNTCFFAAFFTGLMVGPIIQGAMAESVGWRSFWWLNGALNCFTLLVITFAFPETKWTRSTRPTSQGRTETPEMVGEKSDMEVLESGELPSRSETSNSGSSMTASQDIASRGAVVGRGRPSKGQFRLFQSHPAALKSLLVGFYQPFLLVMFPAVIWSAFIHSFSASQYLMITLVQAEGFEAPPYLFGSQSVGFLNFASLVGAFIGLFTAGPLSDWVAMRLTKRNNGVREPEMRLLTLIPYGLVMILGNFVMGFGLKYKWDWRAIAVIGFGCAGIQGPALSSIASTYAIDSYKPAAASIFIIVTLARDLWGFGMSKFIAPWVAQSGFLPPFMTNMCLLTLWLFCGAGLWFYGKSIRRWSAKSFVHRL